MRERLLTVFLIAISAFPPLSTDMYLPSLPAVVAEFGATDAEANFTLVAFFIAFGVSTLVWGPLSDKYGRRPVLIVGLVLYFAGGLLCALSGSVAGMTAARVLQGVGGGSGMAVSSAIVKDVYRGRRQEGILAAIQSMVMICPVIAPLIGSAIIGFTDWRGVFYAQVILGGIVLVGAIFFKETLRAKNDIGVFSSLARLGSLLRHGGFTVFIILFNLPNLCLMAYVASSSFIYQDGFGLGYVQYSLFFAVGASGSIAGPALYMAISKRVRRLTIVTVCLSVLIACGVLAVTIGGLSPWHFAVLMFAQGILCSAIRPPGAFIVLNYHEGDTGSASALLNSLGFLTGSIGMALVTLSPDYIVMVGAFGAAVGTASLILWLAVSRRHDVG